MTDPETFDLEEILSVDLRQKLEAAEQDCEEGRNLEHEQAVAEAATWFRS
jgi:hypothetical protein